MKRFLSTVLFGLMLLGLPISVCAQEVNEEKDVIVLYTNDVHCAIDNYDTLAAYAVQLEEKGHDVFIVDAGDHIQGEVIGSMTKGEAIVELMNEAGYDYAVPGNHEFDYQMENFLNLANNKAKYSYLAANFVDLRTKTTVFEAYDIVEAGGEKIAFVGIATPETYTKSTPAYFQDEDGNDIYSFSENDFYSTIQDAIDDAKAEGAERIIAVGHLGVEGTTAGWKSTDVIANTEGIDVFLDAHAHEVIPGTEYIDKGGDSVILTSTGGKFEHIGQLTIDVTENTEQTELLNPEKLTFDNASESVLNVYNRLNEKIEVYNAQVEELNNAVVGVSEVDLVQNYTSDNSISLRMRETNLGDFVADAYRIGTDADIALVNGGGIRAPIPAGDVTRLTLKNVNPWDNEMCVIEATGQQIIDALEHGTRLYPESSGGFLQVSGLTYEIHSYVESPVVTDEKSNFVSVDDTKERRVKDVTIAGKTIDPEKTYTVAGSYYVLKNGGDGYTMFKDCEVIKKETLPVDSEMLIQYFQEDLNGVITSAQYGNEQGDGRINVVDTIAEEVPEEEDSKTEDDSVLEDNSQAQEKSEIDQPEADEKTEAAKTGDEAHVLLWLMLMTAFGMIIVVNVSKNLLDKEGR